MVRSTPSTRVNDTPVAEWAVDRAAIDLALAELSDRLTGAIDSSVADAIRYSLLGGGKRLRGLLFLAAYRTAGGKADASRVAAAIEVVHAYSLVHDDLPCMDDDDMRRGRPTVHRVFGVRVAMAAGVAMVPVAATASFTAARRLGLSDDVCGSIVAMLMRASGAGGMIGGQLLDLEGEDRPLDISELERIHRAKTGALISASIELGGVTALASPSRMAALSSFGQAIGLAFQIADDVLDVTATTDRLGKPALLGIAGATERANSLASEGCATLRAAGLLSTELDALARFVVERDS
jgi:geranylgeranyl diphosphate synthase, type II